MAFPCPRCGDRYTQSLPMVWGSGLHVRRWSSGLWGGHSESQSLVGAQAAPPTKRSVLWPLVFLLLVAGGLVVSLRTMPAADSSAPVSVRHVGQRAGRRARQPIAAATPRTVWTEQTRMEASERVFVSFAVLALLPALLLLRALRWNLLGYPRALREWRLLFLCRGCGQVFRAPASYEAGLLSQR